MNNEINIKLNFNSVNVVDTTKNLNVKILMVKGEKGDGAEWGSIEGNITDQTDLIPHIVNVGTSIDSNYRTNILYSKNIWIPTLTNNNVNISPTNCTATLNDDEYTFTATGSDMQFGQIAPENNNYTNSLGTLYEVNNASSIGILLTNTDFTRNYITFYNSNKVSLGYTRIDSNTGSVSVPSGATYFSWRIGMLNATSGTQYKTKIIVLYNTTPTNYEKYISSPSINIDGNEIYNASKDIITAGFSSDYTLNTTGAYLDVPINTIISQIGSNFEINNNEIVCKKDGYVKVNIHCNFLFISGTGNKWVTFNHYHTSLNAVITLNPTGVNNERLDVSGGDRLVKVYAGDKLKVQVYGTQNDVLRAAYSYVTCEYI